MGVAVMIRMWVFRPPCLAGSALLDAENGCFVRSRLPPESVRRPPPDLGRCAR